MAIFVLIDIQIDCLPLYACVQGNKRGFHAEVVMKSLTVCLPSLLIFVLIFSDTKGLLYEINSTFLVASLALPAVVNAELPYFV